MNFVTLFSTLQIITVVGSLEAVAFWVAYQEQGLHVHQAAQYLWTHHPFCIELIANKQMKYMTREK